MAMNQKQLLSFPYMVILTVFLHNGFGLLLGYFGARLLKSNERDSRTIAIEVGMQNSGLGVALANQFFSPLSALPSAIFSLWHNLSGSLLASYWSKR
jgi:BASS family bile acid:Na+ symporter